MEMHLIHISTIFEMRHDYAFNGAVVSNLITNYQDQDILTFKLFNCTTQYKSKKVFAFWKNLSATEKEKKNIVYFGHGEVLVDTASGFGVKDHLRKAIVLEDWFFNSATEIYDYLIY